MNIDVVETICSILDELRSRADGKAYSRQISFVKDRPGHDRRYAINPAKIQRELGWRPKESFESGLRKTVMWYFENANGVERVTSGACHEWVSKQYA